MANLLKIKHKEQFHNSNESKIIQNIAICPLNSTLEELDRHQAMNLIKQSNIIKISHIKGIKGKHLGKFSKI